MKVNDILALNKLKRRELWIGETLKIPASGKASEKTTPATTSKVTETKTKVVSNTTSESKEKLPKYHTVKKGKHSTRLPESTIFHQISY